ncbi:unnamed protein product [Cuscuta campestris]|uniref:Expansin-like EG45 domain-containing protein n=1 Tax=Cuscuta campestris TaxID=132261 RepID=A0A484NIC3_9ASTE|nr:unnamed protein product [Cuscuta campestris]
MRALSSSSSSSSPTIMKAGLLLMVCLIDRVSSSSKPPGDNGVGVGYEYVGTVYAGGQQSNTWAAPCFLQNSATLKQRLVDFGSYLYTVTVMPHHGRCWTCRDDYQMKLGDQILATGSTYFGGVDNDFTLYYHRADIPNIESQGIDIYVDMNSACNGLPKGAMKNPFKRAVESVAAID